MKTLLLEFIENALSAALGSLSLIKKVQRHKVRNRVNLGGSAFNNASNCRVANRNNPEFSGPTATGILASASSPFPSCR